MTSAHVAFYKGKIFGVLFIVFICGVAAGGVGMKAYLEHTAEPRTQTDFDPDSPRLAVERLKEELALDDKQFSEVHSVLDECIMQEADMFSRIESLRSDGRARIERILNDQQRETFRNLLLEASDRR